MATSSASQSARGWAPGRTGTVKTRAALLSTGAGPDLLCQGRLDWRHGSRGVYAMQQGADGELCWRRRVAGARVESSVYHRHI